jgi:LPXTG-site transpeptidase (sortase) family protein
LEKRVAAPVESVFADLKETLHFDPITVSIEGDVQLDIEQLGLDTDGKLQDPDAWENAGWYVNSAKPGEKGNVVILGHNQDEEKVPAAFWGLKNLKVNDRVILQDEIRRNYSYRVIDIFYVDIQDPQRTQVFEETNKAELTLMTCGGIWDPAFDTYDKRLVVKAELISTN